MQGPYALRSLLAAVNEPGPYIIAGHSVGGQLALQFGALFPNLTAGLALIDSYAETAIDLELASMGDVSFTYANTTVNLELTGKANFSSPDPFTGSPGMIFTLNIIRAVVPFGWARLITTQTGSSYRYAAALSALYGNNKEWQAQWIDVLSIGAGNTVDRDIASLSTSNRSWQGTRLPDFGAMPVLLLPATKTLELPAGCEQGFAGNASCQAQVLARPKGWYAKLYLAYAASLSSNATLSPIAGGHDIVTMYPKVLADALLAKFRGV